jgi:hypothetical protein
MMLPPPLKNPSHSGPLRWAKGRYPPPRHTVRQVADLLGVSRSEAGRLRVRATADGILGAVGEDESEEVEPALEGRFRLN